MPFDDVLERLTPPDPKYVEAARRRRLAELASLPLYKGLMFEHPIPYDGDEKKLLYFDVSLERIKQAGFQRHPRPAEAFGLLADHVEEKLSSDLEAIASNMLESYGEWLSLALERRGDVLIAYVDPEGFVWEKGKYAKTEKFGCSEQKEFRVAGKPSTPFIDLGTFDDELVRFLYGRSFEQLPQEMREGERRAQVWLPPEGAVWPAGRGDFVFVGFGVFGGRASRGVRARA